MTGGRKRALLVVGSPKGGGSTSEALGRYLLSGLERRGMQTDAASIPRALRSEEKSEELMDAVRGADLLVLASPLYTDSLPSGATRWLELIAAQEGKGAGRGGKRFAALINCGFPEARHCDTAIAICRCFAREAGMEWAGGLALGGGESIGGRPLTEAGGVARNARQALDLAADALSEGGRIPDEAVSLMARPAVSPWIYTLIGNVGWRIKARKHGVGRRLKDRPCVP